MVARGWVWDVHLNGLTNCSLMGQAVILIMTLLIIIQMQLMIVVPTWRRMWMEMHSVKTDEVDVIEKEALRASDNPADVPVQPLRRTRTRTVKPPSCYS